METGRTYGGESSADRSSRQRRQLLGAGVQVFGSSGYRTATVRGLCAQAHVAHRVYYDEFGSMEELFLAVYDDCTSRLESAVVEAVSAAERRPGPLARAGLDALFRVVEDDPRIARVVWFEASAISLPGREVSLRRLEQFTDMLASVVAGSGALGDHDPVALRVVLTSLVGGISHALLVWTESGCAEPRSTWVGPLSRSLISAIATARAST